MKTEAELLCEEYGMEYPNTDDIMHVLKGTRNPVPSKTKLGDYFINQWGWQIRMIIRIEGSNCAYECYHLEDISTGNSYRLIDGKKVYSEKNPGRWVKKEWYGSCSLAHMRSWCNK